MTASAQSPVYSTDSTSAQSDNEMQDSMYLDEKRRNDSHELNLEDLHGAGHDDTDKEDPSNDPDVILKALLKEGPGAWTKAEEKRVLRLTDWRVMLWACVMFFSLELDRANISNVLTTDFLVNNDMTTNDYNLGQTVFLVCFLVMEIPSQMVIRYFGPEIWIPIMMTGWGIVAFCQAFIKDRASFLVTRALLGVCEGGFIPGLVLYLSSFYQSHELAIRFSWIWSMSSMTDIVSSLLAVGILQMKGVHGWFDWQWLFLIEGLLTTVIGICTAFVLPSIRKKKISRCYTSRETAILRAKVILDDSSKTRALERGRHLHINLRTIFFSLFDIYLLPIYFLGFFGYIPSLQGRQYLTINLRAMHFTTLQSNLLTIPGSIICIICMLFVSKLSDKFRIRWVFPIVASIWVIPNLIALLALPDNASRWARYVPLTLIVGYPYFHPIMIAWVSQNSNDHERRAIAAAWYNIFVQCGKIAGSNIYQQNDKPFYHKGNSALIGIACANALVAVLAKALYTYANKKRARKMEAMSAEDLVAYKDTTHDEGNRRLDFQLYT
ncbi:major facilitator superfamily domain-containing protein [Lipomyces arxii]|uniref:major facilitator superfamily domain-containing protein n=1 Tax=Lipomyces arxii TaxID=56418 RepID=UPI0034CF7BD2